MSCGWQGLVFKRGGYEKGRSGLYRIRACEQGPSERHCSHSQVAQPHRQAKFAMSNLSSSERIKPALTRMSRSEVESLTRLINFSSIFTGITFLSASTFLIRMVYKLESFCFFGSQSTVQLSVSASRTFDLNGRLWVFSLHHVLIDEVYSCIPRYYNHWTICGFLLVRLFVKDVNVVILIRTGL